MGWGGGVVGVWGRGGGVEGTASRGAPFFRARGTVVHCAHRTRAAVEAREYTCSRQRVRRAQAREGAGRAAAGRALPARGVGDDHGGAGRLRRASRDSSRDGHARRRRPPSSPRPAFSPRRRSATPLRSDHHRFLSCARRRAPPLSRAAPPPSVSGPASPSSSSPAASRFASSPLHRAALTRRSTRRPCRPASPPSR